MPPLRPRRRGDGARSRERTVTARERALEVARGLVDHDSYRGAVCATATPCYRCTDLAAALMEFAAEKLREIGRVPPPSQHGARMWWNVIRRTEQEFRTEARALRGE